MTEVIEARFENATAAKLKSFVARIERLNAEREALAEDLKSVYDEAKGQGFDTRVLRAVIRLRKIADEKRREQQEIMELYTGILGMD